MKETQDTITFPVGSVMPDPRKVTIYTCGFLFGPDRRQCALIRKDHPEWQAGLLNGIGGKLKPLEPPPAAMVRKFEEEAGLTGVEFEEFARLHGGDYRVHFFRGFDQAVVNVKTMTSEEVYFYALPIVRRDIVPNLRWLIPLALDEFLRPPVLLFDRDTYG